MRKYKSTTEVQTYLFPRDTWSARDARSWLTSHSKKAPAVDKTAEYLRYRQSSPGRFKKGSFRTITLPTTNIKAVIGKPRIEKRGNPMEIIAINPRKKRRAKPAKRRPGRPRKSAPKPKRSKATMARKKRRRRRSTPKTRTRTKTVIRYRTRRPRRRRRNPSRASAYARQTIAGVNIPGAVKDAIPMLLGALAGKAAAKKFASGGAETDNWSWANYLWCLGGGLIAAVGTSAIFKGKRATAQRVFTGALVLTAYKWFTGDVAPRNTTLESWFGAEDEEEERLIESAAAAIDPYAGLFGEISEMPEGDFQMLGQTEVLTPATARLGQYMEPATARMGGLGDDVTRDFEAAYR